MPLRRRSRPRFDCIAAGERSLAGHKPPLREWEILPLEQVNYFETGLIDPRIARAMLESEVPTIRNMATVMAEGQPDQRSR